MRARELLLLARRPKAREADALDLPGPVLHRGQIQALMAVLHPPGVLAQGTPRRPTTSFA